MQHKRHVSSGAGGCGDVSSGERADVKVLAAGSGGGCGDVSGAGADGKVATSMGGRTHLVLVELGEAGDGGDDVGRLVEDGDRGGAQSGAAALEVIKVHQRLVAMVLGEHGHLPRGTKGGMG